MKLSPAQLRARWASIPGVYYDAPKKEMQAEVEKKPVSELAAEFNVAPMTARKWLEAAHCPKTTINRAVFYDAAQARRIIEHKSNINLPTEIDESIWIQIKNAPEIVGLSRSRLFKMAHSGALQFRRIKRAGIRLYLRRDELAALKNKQH